MPLRRHAAHAHQRQGVSSRLDWHCTNLHPSCFLDERIGIEAADWAHSKSRDHQLSTHRPVSVFRRGPTGDSGRGLPLETGHCPAWKDRARPLYADRFANDRDGRAAPAFGPLRLLKEATAEAVAGLRRAAPRELPRGNLGGQLPRVMRGLQGAQRQDHDLLHEMAAVMPELAPCSAMQPLVATRFLQGAVYGCAQAAARAQLEEAQTARQGGEPEGALRGLRHPATQTFWRLRSRAEQAALDPQRPGGSVT